MTTLLVQNADHIVTMDDPEPDFGPGDILIEANRVAGIFSPDDPNRPGIDCADRVVDASGKAVFPGLVNTHHHFFQILTRNLPAMQNDELFDWLTKHYDVWVGITGEMVEVGAMAAVGELLLSGCTCTSDHHYLFPHGTPPDLIDRQIKAAATLGIRFHPTRGSMEVGLSKGGLPPDRLTEDADAILDDCGRVIDTYHDPSPLAMCRLALAPCAPFSASEDLMRRTAELARRRGVRLHTHLGETLDEERYCLKTHGCRPFEFAKRLGWIGDDVWFAHAIHFNADEIREMGREGVGIAHCPASNARLGSGIAPVREMLDAGVAVGIGVDGSASNDSSNLLADLRVALYAHRMRNKPEWLTAHDVLFAATRGGARVLGRNDVGVLRAGLAADLFLVDFEQVGYVGSRSDHLAAVVYNSPLRPVHTTIANGRVVVENGTLVGADESDIAQEGHRLSAELIARTGAKPS